MVQKDNSLIIYQWSLDYGLTKETLKVQVVQDD